VRKGPLADFLGSKVGQALIAQSVLAATAFLAKQQAEPGSSARKAARGARQALEEGAQTLPAGPSALTPAMLANAFSAAGKAFAESIQDRIGPAAESPDDDWPADFAAPSGQASAKSSKAESAPAKPH
jgi:hypothetical protein